MDGCGVWRRWGSWGIYEGKGWREKVFIPLEGWELEEALVGVPKGAPTRCLPKMGGHPGIAGGKHRQACPFLIGRSGRCLIVTRETLHNQPYILFGNMAHPGSLALSVCMLILGRLGNLYNTVA
jgi:hypothetical protein